jgi:hypothetical protein
MSTFSIETIRIDHVAHHLREPNGIICIRGALVPEITKQLLEMFLPAGSVHCGNGSDIETVSSNLRDCGPSRR